MSALEAFRDRLAVVLRANIDSVLVGAASDMNKWAEEIANDATEAMAVGNQAVLDELRAQVLLISERNRLRAVGAGWEAVGSIVGAALGAGMAALTEFGPRLAAADAPSVGAEPAGDQENPEPEDPPDLA